MASASFAKLADARWERFWKLRVLDQLTIVVEYARSPETLLVIPCRSWQTLKKNRNALCLACYYDEFFGAFAPPYPHQEKRKRAVANMIAAFMRKEKHAPWALVRHDPPAVSCKRCRTLARQGRPTHGCE